MKELALTLLVGCALFAIKLGGYFLAARRWGPRLFPGATASPMKAALVRVALGVVAGGVALGVATLVGNMIVTEHSSQISFAVGVGLQLTLRALAWLAVIALFYDRKLARRGAVVRAVAGGVVLSYLLDLPNYALAVADVAYVMRDFRMC